MRELSDIELKRLDDVHNTIHRMLCDLACTEIPWDISVIGEISDIAEQHICDALGIMTAAEFAPFVESRSNAQISGGTPPAESDC